MTQSILVVDLGNICISPMLALFLRQALHNQGKNHTTVLSAGLFTHDGHANRPVEAGVYTIMMERDLKEILSHRSRRASSLPLPNFARIFCMNDHERISLMALGAKYEQIHVVRPPQHSIPNPVGREDIREFRNCAKTLEALA